MIAIRKDYGAGVIYTDDIKFYAICRICGKVWEFQSENIAIPIIQEHLKSHGIFEIQEVQNINEQNKGGVI